jgi:hypothetical protein
MTGSETGFGHVPTETLVAIRANLVAGLDLVAAHVKAGTFHDIPVGKSAPPSQSGQLTLALLEQVDAELDRRELVDQPRVVLCDIDGTIALMGKGEPGRREPYDWSRVGEDDPCAPIVALVGILRSAGFRIVYVSGRDEACRRITESWLLHHGLLVEDELLLMRPAGDNRPDHEVKLEIYRRRVEPHYNVAYVLDDRDQVVRMWRSLGLTVLQVAEGDF